jgi:hypothetical protein
MSVWSFKDEAYLNAFNIQELHPLFSAIYRLKFGELPQLPLPAVAVAAPAAVDGALPSSATVECGASGGRDLGGDDGRNNDGEGGGGDGEGGDGDGDGDGDGEGGGEGGGGGCREGT